MNYKTMNLFKAHSLFLSIFFVVALSFGQTNDSIKNNQRDQFTISISKFNHADRIINGTWNYTIKDNVLEISKSNAFNKTDDTLLYKYQIEDSLISNLKKVNLDSLSDHYFNNCVLITSGNEYYIFYQNASIKKKVHLHHYYHEQIEKIVLEFNKLIPEEFKINYLSEDTEQDCR